MAGGGGVGAGEGREMGVIVGKEEMEEKIRKEEAREKKKRRKVRRVRRERVMVIIFDK